MRKWISRPGTGTSFRGSDGVKMDSRLRENDGLRRTCPCSAGDKPPRLVTRRVKEASQSVTPAKAGVQGASGRVEDGFRFPPE